MSDSLALLDEAERVRGCVHAMLEHLFLSAPPAPPSAPERTCDAERQQLAEVAARSLLTSEHRTGWHAAAATLIHRELLPRLRQALQVPR